MNRILPLLIPLVLVASTRCFSQTLGPYTLWGNPTGASAAAMTLPSHTIIPCMAPLSCPSGIADPTGASDSYGAIQAAINAAYAHDTGGTLIPATVYLPSGTYKLSQPLQLNYSGITLEGDTSWGTVIEPVGQAISISTAGPNRGAASVLVRNLEIVGNSSTTVSTGGLISIVNAYDSDLENVDVLGVSNAIANGIYISNSGNINLKNVNVYGALGTGTPVTTTGILVTTNSQVSIDNGDVEGFNGTNGKGIATSGELVYLDLISSHVEGNWYGYYHGASYLPVSGTPTAGRTNIFGGFWIYGAGPATIRVAGDNLAIYGTTQFYGGPGLLDIPAPATGGAYKNIIVDTQTPSTGRLFTPSSDLSGVHLRNQKLAVGGSGVLAANRLDFSDQNITSGTQVSLFSIYNFSPGTFRLYLTVDAGASFGGTASAAAYQVDFTVTNGDVVSTPIVTALGSIAGSFSASATFAVTSNGSNGVVLKVTPTAAEPPTISGYLDYYGVDYYGAQSVVATYCSPTGSGC